MNASGNAETGRGNTLARAPRTDSFTKAILCEVSKARRPVQVGKMKLFMSMIHESDKIYFNRVNQWW